MGQGEDQGQGEDVRHAAEISEIKEETKGGMVSKEDGLVNCTPDNSDSCYF